jgi:hypothetical protein
VTVDVALAERAPAARSRDREIVFANGARGQNIDVASANPLNYWQGVSAAGLALTTLAAERTITSPIDER